MGHVDTARQAWRALQAAAAEWEAWQIAQANARPVWDPVTKTSRYDEVEFKLQPPEGRSGYPRTT